PIESEAQRLERAGEHAEAARALTRLAEARDLDASGDAAQLRLRAAEAWLRAGEAERARGILVELDQPFDAPTDQARLDLAWAELSYMLGDLSEARLRLARAASDLPASEATRFSLLDDLVRRAEANPARLALAELEDAIYGDQFSPDLALALLIDHPLAALTELELQQRHRPELAPWLDLVVTARAVLLDPPRLDDALRAWAVRHPSVGYPPEAAAAWLEAWRQTRPIARRIMVALPGNDRLQPASQALRNGLMSAWLALRPSDRPELLFREVEDTPDGIISLWFEARELGVDQLIGPLEREQVDRLTQLPDAGLPILLLNHPSDPMALEAMSGDIQAVGLIPEEEAELAAVQALVLGHERALIIAQSSDWGRRVAQAFERTFRLGGGRIMDRADYSPTQPDQSAMLEVLLNLDHSEQRAADISRLLGQEVEFEPQPRTDVDLIFLASRPADARLLRPQLRFQRVGDLPVFATSQALAGAPTAERDRDLDGMIIPLPPWFIDDSAFGQDRQRTERRFASLQNPLLSILHALGADAFELTRWGQRLQDDPALYLAGRTGRLRLPSGRRVERDLPFVRIDNGQAGPLQ
ncbi:MAG: penicillin-binding protein activator, partial [Pseudomonadota bacterium]